MKPLPSLPSCPTQLCADDIEQFNQTGYLAFRDALTPQELEAARGAISELVQRLVRSQSITRKGPFWIAQGDDFGVQFEAGYEPASNEAHEADAGEDMAEVELKVRKLMWFCGQHPHFGYLSAEHPRLRGVLQSLIGQSPIFFQDMALIKPPHIGSEKPWHQDNAYFAVAPLEAVVGIWIALDDATTENGCMHVLPGGQRRGALKHFHGRDCEIVADRIEPSQAVPVELPAGGALFFAGMLPHQTPPNASPHRRRALQFHYRAASSRIVERDEYDHLYAEADGTPASCAAAPRAATSG